MLYSLFRPLLFALDPEQAHRAAFSSLDAVARMGLARAFLPSVPADPITLMGIAFPNRVGLAAGLDKNAEHIDGLAALGFGFIECGTVTPRAQPGNPQPRLFRLAGAQALVNRMGFNNAGVARFLDNTSRAAWRGVLGLNIGKNFDTPNDRAADDYLACLRAVYVRASYVTVNISSPNTKGLRDLQADALGPFLRRLKNEQASLADRHGKYTPLLLKIAPDLDPAGLQHIARLLVAHRVDGVIATNTTTSREGVAEDEGARESGGLSGEPLRARSTEVVRQLAHTLDGALPIIGVGGIASGEDALEKIDAGASLVQLYTGLIYRGPQLVVECGRALARRRAAGRRRK
ncbi:MAG: quinone-dependent dihydroorotate dehydrogenase [Casimicrobiaceae bacterium]